MGGREFQSLKWLMGANYEEFEDEIVKGLEQINTKMEQ
jgi:hypothetical protein